MGRGKGIYERKESLEVQVVERHIQSENWADLVEIVWRRRVFFCKGKVVDSM